MLLPLLVLSCVFYIAYAVYSIMRAKARGESMDSTTYKLIVKFLSAGAVPIAVAATMTFLFLIIGGATTVQFNAGSPSRMNVWSTWVDLWPGFLLLSIGSAFGSLIWAGVCAAKKETRPSTVIPIISLLLSTLAFFTVASYFPSA
jgi:hypothetical protein